jgi:hypothetical protein
MSFNGDEGTVVTLKEASVWTANYRKTIPVGGTIAHFIGKNKLNMILQQKDCVGVRVYYGIDEKGNKNLVFVGADANENDLADGVIVEYAVRCPPRCSTSNALNS